MKDWLNEEYVAPSSAPRGGKVLRPKREDIHPIPHPPAKEAMVHQGVLSFRDFPLELVSNALLPLSRFHHILFAGWHIYWSFLGGCTSVGSPSGVAEDRSLSPGHLLCAFWRRLLYWRRVIPDLHLPLTYFHSRHATTTLESTTTATTPIIPENIFELTGTSLGRRKKIQQQLKIT